MKGRYAGKFLNGQTVGINTSLWIALLPQNATVPIQQTRIIRPKSVLSWGMYDAPPIQEA
jgi:hypothetical protein